MPGQDGRDPREPLASVTGTLEKEESRECCVGFDLDGFCSQSVWVNLLVPNRAGGFRVTAPVVSQFCCFRGAVLQVLGKGNCSYGFMAGLCWPKLSCIPWTRR